ncbi:MAG: hypothetical protein F2749_04795, partial [Actinobacteria bacterium]|nr:hypothetical protein [Actinomycetota bacterium]
MRPITRGLLAGLTVSTFALAGCSSDSKTAATTTTEAAADDTAAADEP